MHRLGNYQKRNVPPSKVTNVQSFYLEFGFWKILIIAMAPPSCRPRALKPGLREIWARRTAGRSRKQRLGGEPEQCSLVMWCEARGQPLRGTKGHLHATASSRETVMVVRCILPLHVHRRPWHRPPTTRQSVAGHPGPALARGSPSGVYGGGRRDLGWLGGRAFSLRRLGLRHGV